jgi:hypothetical protein
VHAELLKNNWFYNDSGSSSSKVLNGREPAIENELCDVDNLLGAARHCCAAAMRCSAARTKSAILHSCRALGKQLAGGCQNFATFSLRAVLVGRPTVGRRLRRRPQTQSDPPTSIFHLGQLYNQLNAMWAIGVCVTWWASNPLGACQVTLHFNFEHSLQSCLCLC